MERATRKPRLTKAQVRDFVFWLFEKNEDLRKNATSGLIKQMYLKEMNMDVSQPFVKQNRDAWIKIDNEIYRKDRPWMYRHLINEEQK